MVTISTQHCCRITHPALLLMVQRLASICLFVLPCLVLPVLTWVQAWLKEVHGVKFQVLVIFTAELFEAQQNDDYYEPVSPVAWFVRSLMTREFS